MPSDLRLDKNAPRSYHRLQILNCELQVKPSALRIPHRAILEPTTRKAAAHCLRILLHNASVFRTLAQSDATTRLASLFLKIMPQGSDCSGSMSPFLFYDAEDV